MALRKSLCFLLFLVTLISCTHARTFEVGGKDGWTTSPSENYNSWAGRLRFLINDSLHFKYNSGDSVLVVSKGDYDGCNVNNPITKLEGGDSTFKLDRSGPFYFISGNKSNCDQGQKMTVVVITPKNRSSPPGAATPPSPAATPPSPAATPPSPAATPPSSTATPPSSTATPPSSTTATPPSSIATPPSASPVSDSPESSVSPSPISASPESSVSPSGAPTTTPSGDAPAMTPGASSPGAAGGPSGAADSPGGAAAGGPGGAAGPPGTNPSDTNSPSGATQALSGTIMASFVTMVFGLWLLN